MNAQLTRREFIKIAGGSALILGFNLPLEAPRALGQSPQTTFAPNAYLRIDSDDTITIMAHRSEMGQGVQTATPMILADELEADWSKVRIEIAPADRAYGDQQTGGSVSISGSFGILRLAGAVARTMLVSAAAQMWGVDPSECRAENSTVIRGEQRLTYGELAATAAALPVPETLDVRLKDRADFRLIGTSVPNVLTPQYVDGSAVFGTDVRLDGMLYAAVARSPVAGGEVISYDDSQALAFEGVRQVIQMQTGVAVVADNSWAALQGRDLLEIEWNEGEFAAQSSETIIETLAASIPPSEEPVALEAVYQLPYLAHATMEPMNATADVRADSCDVWAPTQDRQGARSAAVAWSGLPDAAVNFHLTLVGCGLGRRLRVDYVGEAVEVSRLVGAPVKLVWSREDDLRNGAFRPIGYHVLRVALDDQGNLARYEHHVAGQRLDGGELAGLQAGPYKLPEPSINFYGARYPLQMVYFRSVANAPNAFVRECFMDELAELMGKDPYEFRMELLRSDKNINVLQMAATQAKWGEPLEDGHAQGIAFYTTWGVPCAQVAEVSLDRRSGFRVHRIVCVIDCGTVVNPDMVASQMESSIAVGLSSLFSQITLKDGRVQEGNFHDYPLLTMEQMPLVDVYTIPSEESPAGVGEMGIPPAVPAVLNALYKLTGKRIRRLPISEDDL